MGRKSREKRDRKGPLGDFEITLATHELSAVIGAVDYVYREFARFGPSTMEPEALRFKLESLDTAVVKLAKAAGERRLFVRTVRGQRGETGELSGCGFPYGGPPEW